MAYLPMHDISDEEKILAGYVDVKWIDDVDEYKCKRCKKVLVQHFISTCGHKFCTNCKRILDDGSQMWRCPECNEFIRHIEQEDFDFRDRVMELQLHCPNHKYGCGHILAVKDLKEHINNCVNNRQNALPSPYVGKLTPEMLELKMMMMQNFGDINAQIVEMKLRMDAKENKSKDKKMEWEKQFEVIKSRVNGFYSDFDSEKKNLRSEIKELKRIAEDKNIQHSVEKNKSEIDKLKGKSEMHVHMSSVNFKNINEEINRWRTQIEKELQAKDVQIQSMIDRKVLTLNKVSDQISIREFENFKTEMHRMINEIKEKHVLYKQLKEYIDDKTSSWLEKKEKELLSKSINKVNTDFLTHSQSMSRQSDKQEQMLIAIENCSLKVKLLEQEMTQIASRDNNLIDVKIDSLKQDFRKQIKEVEEFCKKMRDEIDEKIEMSNSTVDQKLDRQTLEINEQLGDDFQGKLSKLEDEIEKKETSRESTFKDVKQNIFQLERSISLLMPQVDSFNLLNKSGVINPDFVWKVSGIDAKVEQTTFSLVSEEFPWIEYPAIYAKVMLQLKEDGKVFMSLLLKDSNVRKTMKIKLLPAVYYALKNQSEIDEKKHLIMPSNYLFGAKFNYSLNYEKCIVHKTWLNHPLFMVDDSLLFEVYVETPLMAQQVYSKNGTLNWTIDMYREKKQAEKDESMRCQESPYFYTGPRGYRVQAKMWLNGFVTRKDNSKENGQENNIENDIENDKEKGLVVSISFLTGEFDDDLSKHFPHQTTVTLINRKHPELSITRKKDQKIEEYQNYFINMCSEDKI